MIKIYDKPLSVILLYTTLLHAALWIGGHYVVELFIQWYVGWTISLTLGPVWHALIMTTLIIATAYTGYIEETEQPVSLDPVVEAVTGSEDVPANIPSANASIVSGHIVREAEINRHGPLET
jgi:hypothetical protein